MRKADLEGAHLQGASLFGAQLQGASPAYIKHVSEWTGIDPDEHLNLNNKTTMARLVGAIARQEGKLSTEKSEPGRIKSLLHRAEFGKHGHKVPEHTAQVFIHDASGGFDLT